MERKGGNGKGTGSEVTGVIILMRHCIGLS